ncbi:hypothetical protein BLNAU_12952 [Blattamonas nauphoetae]|uniref:UBA domain-containing protein n=1 Tax=Blattamonas nauphoetae TaxID=2049346 RepID=A0ABQ9XI28_9EUKA|nr:hypothetical protein BLNAU_12952 [Blattamonas nauphoetae]
MVIQVPDAITHWFVTKNVAELADFGPLVENQRSCSDYLTGELISFKIILDLLLQQAMVLTMPDTVHEIQTLSQTIPPILSENPSFCQSIENIFSRLISPLPQVINVLRGALSGCQSDVAEIICWMYLKMVKPKELTPLLEMGYDETLTFQAFIAAGFDTENATEILLNPDHSIYQQTQPLAVQGHAIQTQYHHPPFARQELPIHFSQDTSLNHLQEWLSTNEGIAQQRRLTNGQYPFHAWMRELAETRNPLATEFLNNPEGFGAVLFGIDDGTTALSATIEQQGAHISSKKSEPILTILTKDDDPKPLQVDDKQSEPLLPLPIPSVSVDEISEEVQNLMDITGKTRKEVEQALTMCQNDSNMACGYLLDDSGF